jgi:hypothetical protein
VGALAVVGVAAASVPLLRAPKEPISLAPDPVEAAPVAPPGIESDLRVQAFLEVYGDLLTEVAFEGHDARFMVGGKAIHFQDGRLLGGDRLPMADQFDPVFYEYPLGPLTAPPPPAGDRVYSTDLLDALFGSTEAEVRSHGRSVTFLGRKMFVNTFCLEALRSTEAQILDAAQQNPEVASWIRSLEVAYSFQDREITGSDNRSYHTWGLAIDLVPSSFQGLQVYWRWSRVFNPEWHSIPVEERWSPPQPVIEAFERNGFVWGGKWARFDGIHFEYRPEILRYSRLLQEGRVPPEH